MTYLYLIVEPIAANKDLQCAWQALLRSAKVQYLWITSGLPRGSINFYTSTLDTLFIFILWLAASV